MASDEDDDSDESEFTMEDDNPSSPSRQKLQREQFDTPASNMTNSVSPIKAGGAADEDEDDSDFAVSPSPKKKKAKRETPSDDADDDDEPLSAIKQKVKKKKTKVGVDSADTKVKKKKKKRKARDDDDDRSSPRKVKSKTQKVKHESSSTPTSPTKSSSNNNKPFKKLDKTERLEYAMQSFRWWDAPLPPEGYQWGTMEHAGVSFPEPYQPHHIHMRYNGAPVALTPAQEEAATLFVSVPPDSLQLKNAKTAQIFCQNFFDDFKTILGKKHVIKDFTKCDFEPIRQHLNEQKIIRKAITDAERQSHKHSRNQALLTFGYALVDGHLERVGNYNMEPPGAFRGRGEHPKMGRLKTRVAPEQVSLNVSEWAPVPRCPVPGHAWGDVRHDPRGQWLATWKENINNQSKYMQLAAQSSFKGKSDRSKYSKAALLCKHIGTIRASYKKDLKAKDAEMKQLATSTWIIDQLALRVGGEKDTEEEADTVGCCSLRLEHLHFDPNAEGGDNREIELEFLGKDSMLYKQTIDFGAALYNDNNGMGMQVYDNLKAFCKSKKATDDVFDKINPSILNNHLKQFMEGLSAKVFRTYNASKTLQDELRKHEASAAWRNLPTAAKVVEYNAANREVAILCNHQRSVSKAQETQLENLQGKLGTLKKQKKELKAILKRLNSGSTDIPCRKSQQAMEEEVKEAVEKAKKMKEKAKTNEEKIKATKADEKAREKKRALTDAKFLKAHLWEKPPSAEQVMRKIENWTAKIAKMELDLKHKDDNKEVSLGTSKINYMDPRISVAWCKRNEVPIEKVFSKTLRNKFNWAMAVEPEWEFNAEIAKLG